MAVGPVTGVKAEAGAEVKAEARAEVKAEARAEVKAEAENRFPGGIPQMLHRGQVSTFHIITP
jgi:hypothetical protein